jgi:hypothetical protein
VLFLKDWKELLLLLKSWESPQMRLNKTEMKILVYNKMKQKGLSYEQAKKEVELEVNHLKDLTQKKREEKKQNGQTKI